jgi:polygalacturonase
MPVRRSPAAPWWALLAGLALPAGSSTLPAVAVAAAAAVGVGAEERTGVRPGGRAAFDVRDFGAVADGKTKCTDAVRKAIAAARAHGGGTVFFGPGEYLTGPIRLESHITLHIDAGARVKFSDDFDDYLPMVRSRWEGTEVVNFSPLIYADHVEDVAIEGSGVLDGQGQRWWQFFRALRAEQKKTGRWNTDSRWQKEFAARNPALELPDDDARLKSGFLRPPFVQILDSRRVSIRDVKLVSSPFWTINPVYCDNVTVRGVTIENPSDAPNTDGIDPESCRNVHISDCLIDTGDDCITIKSGRDQQGRRINRPSENTTITNCTMLHGHGGVVIGSEMSGGVRNLVASNCVFDGTDRGIRIKSTRGRGGVVENVRMSNIVMRNIVEEAITLNLSYTSAPPEPVSERTPHFRNIRIDGVSGEADRAGTLQGLPETLLEGVALFDIDLKARLGLVVRDARNISLTGVNVDTTVGPAVAAIHVESLALSDVGTHTPHPQTPVLDLTDVAGAFVHGCAPGPHTDVFARVAGRDTRGVVFEGNALTFAVLAGLPALPVQIAPDVPRGAVTGHPSGAPRASDPR